MDELFDQLTDEIVSLRERIAILQAEIDRLTAALADAHAAAILEGVSRDAKEQ